MEDNQSDMSAKVELICASCGYEGKELACVHCGLPMEEKCMECERAKIECICSLLKRH